MKEKIISIVVLTSIFSLFLFYKLNGNKDALITSNSIEMIDGEDINITLENDLSEVADIDINIADMENVNNDNVDDFCSLTPYETDQFSFSKAFKYYRDCLGKDEVFSWNKNNYKTLLASEVIIENNNDNSQSMIVQKNQTIDKEHFDLQNQMFGNNSSK